MAAEFLHASSSGIERADSVCTTTTEISIAASSTAYVTTPTSVVNLLLLGKVGVGKARMMNETFQKPLFETKASTPVVRGVSQREKEFVDAGIRFRVKIFDIQRAHSFSSRVSISKTMSAIRKYLVELYPSGVNMILLVYRYEDLSNDELKNFKYILRRLNEDQVPLITALVINGCADKNEASRKKLISDFDTNPRTQMIGRYVLQGMYAVGFADLSAIASYIVDMYEVINRNDAASMRKVLEKCYSRQLTVNVFFSQGSCNGRCFYVFPWRCCPCYSQIYKCWRWGYTWDDCMNVDSTAD